MMMRFDIGLAVGVVVLAAACSSPDVAGPVVTDPAELPWRMALSTHAVTMSTQAPYDTLQLTALPKTLDGAQLEGVVVTFTSSDSSVRVSPTGLLTARGVRTNVRIIASALHRGISIADTAVVNVTASVPSMFDRLQFEVPAGDSAKMAVANVLSRAFGMPDFKSLQVQVLNPGGGSIPNAVVVVRVSDIQQMNLPDAFALGATLGNGVTNTNFTGANVPVFVNSRARVGASVTVYAEATVYGVTRRDSLQILITPPLFVAYSLRKSASLFTVNPNYQSVVSVGATVLWFNLSTSVDSLDVVFDNPSAAAPDLMFFPSGQGNIDAFPGNANAIEGDPTPFARSRQFNQPGTYPWRSLRTGVSGVIVVQ